MAKFITLGVYTAKGLAGFVDNPETDRKAATSALAAAAGAKLTRYAGLRGKYDFMAEMEGTFDQCAAAAMVAVAQGWAPSAPVRLYAQGGILTVDFKGSGPFTDVVLTGPAMQVFKGLLPL